MLIPVGLQLIDNSHKATVPSHFAQILPIISPTLPKRFIVYFEYNNVT